MIANRPLVWIAAAYAAGIAGYAWGWAPRSIVLAAVCAVLAGGALYLAPASNRLRSGLLLAAFAALGAAMAAAHLAGARHDPLALAAWEAPRSAVVAEGRVRQPRLFHPPKREGLPPYLTFELLVDTVYEDGAAVHRPGRAIVHWSGATRPVYSDERVVVKGLIDPALSRVNFGVDGYEDYLRNRGVHSAIRARGPDAVASAGDARRWWLPHWTSRLRQAQADRFRALLPPETLPFVFTIWLGDASGIGDEAYRRYAAAGTAHILAVSGIHMSILYGTLAFLMPATKRRRTRAVVQMVLLLAFALVAGARLSALRAATMFAIYLLADVTNRERDAPTALSLAALLFLADEPMLLFNTGALLSFLSVASLLLFAPRTEGDETAWLRQGLAGAFRSAVTVQLLPLPVALRAFHVLPVFSPFTNLIVIPLLGVAVWLCVLTSLIALVSPAFGSVFGHALLPVVWLIETATDAAAGLPFSHVYLTTPTALAVVFYLAGLAVMARGAESLRKRALFAAPLFAFALAVWRPPVETPMIALLDVGHGDATVIRAPGGEVVLIDGGDRFNEADLGHSVVAPFLWAHGVTRIDTVVATHPDRDHIGGLFAVLERFEVGEVWLWPHATGAPLEAGLIQACIDRGVPYRRIAAPAVIPATGMELRVVHPGPDWPDGSSDNDQSLVVLASWEGATALLTGDIEERAEAALAPALGPVSALKAPHHGSATSSTAALLEAARPSAAVVSTGVRANRAPVHPQVEAAYRVRGIPLYRTDRHGGLRLNPEAGRFRVETARGWKGYLGPADPAYESIE